MFIIQATADVHNKFTIAKMIWHSTFLQIKFGLNFRAKLRQNAIGLMRKEHKQAQLKGIFHPVNCSVSTRNRWLILLSKLWFFFFNLAKLTSYNYNNSKSVSYHEL
jgi:hypothetical protein